MGELSLNRVYSTPRMHRRYEVWFLRLALADRSGAWWFRYLLMNRGHADGGCPGQAGGMPVQVWATWFPRGAPPQSFIQGYPQHQLSVSARGASPFHMEISENRIGEDFAAGRLGVDGHTIAWNLRYRSCAGFTMSDKGWIGFSRTPHSDAVFSGEIMLDGRRFTAEPLGYGVQGHNCGFRHRHMWSWAHCVMRGSDGALTTLEALVYEMPLGLRFRKAVLWHKGQIYNFRRLREWERDREKLQWKIHCRDKNGAALEACFDGSSVSAHRLSYLKTNCTGTFEVANNSLARAALRLVRPGESPVELRTEEGAVVEMTGG